MSEPVIKIQIGGQGTVTPPPQEPESPPEPKE
jgi:hypothetical protein